MGKCLNDFCNNEVEYFDFCPCCQKELDATHGGDEEPRHDLESLLNRDKNDDDDVDIDDIS